MISLGFQRSLSAGEVAGLCYGLVMDSRYCRLCLGAGCFLGPGFVFTLGVSLLVSIYSSAQRGFLSVTWGGCWWNRCVFVLCYERALRSSFGPRGIWLEMRVYFCPPCVCFNQFLCQAAVFILSVRYLISRGEISCSPGWWVSRIVIHKVRDWVSGVLSCPALQPFSTEQNLSK